MASGVLFKFTAYTETLATAIQDNFDELLALVREKPDDVVKLLSQELCIKESERMEIMSMENCEQNIRLLLVRIRGKNFPKLVKFLDTVKNISGKEGELLTQDIYADYDRLRQKKLVDYVCAFCNIKDNVALFEIAGYLWKRKLISSRTHATILKPGNIQEEELWDKLLNERRALNIITQIQAYLEEDGLFTHLAEELGQQAKIQHNIKCACANSTLRKRFQNIRRSTVSSVSLNTNATQESVLTTNIRVPSTHSSDNITSPSGTYNFRHVLRCVFFPCRIGKSN